MIKKTILLFIAAMLVGVMPSMAQKKNYRKTRTNQRTVSRVKKPVVTVPAITFTDPVVVNGHLAFLGVDIQQSPLEIIQQLKAKGLSEYPKEEGEVYPTLHGNIYGVNCQVSIYKDDNAQTINFLETSGYAKTKARDRVNSLAAAFAKATGGKITDSNTKYNSDKGCDATIESKYGIITVGSYLDNVADNISKPYIVTGSFMSNE